MVKATTVLWSTSGMFAFVNYETLATYDNVYRSIERQGRFTLHPLLTTLCKAGTHTHSATQIFNDTDRECVIERQVT